VSTATHFRAYCTNGHVVAEGELEADGSISLKGSGSVSHVAFYAGEGDDITCVGMVDINQEGAVEFTVSCPPPPEPITPVIVTANEPSRKAPAADLAVVPASDLIADEAAPIAETITAQDVGSLPAAVEQTGN
jgi:hypothetical protein